ncbi:uncharacterized protein LOC6568244 [Drosophila grimshawi]|uniref:uncharacterized protein LOC6568244 n=1 Tax=Drosophila grimshawi TaxID=7222 RepID=UPI000C86EFAD|nr:uncharacterized protein LOC6568244 [Drosophila grimshawi]
MHNPREHLRCRRRGCTYTTNRAYNLERHERNHDKGKVPVSQYQPCPHCTYAAGSLHNLMRHISKKHAALSGKTTTKQQAITSQQQAEQTKVPPSTEAKSESLPNCAERIPEHLTESLIPAADSSLWFWSTPQQLERNFLRRSALKEECKIQERSIKLFKFYALVRARGGALNVDQWEDVAAALGLPSGSGCQTRVKYMELLYEFEKKEEERSQEWKNVEGLPSWWDDGDFVTDNMHLTSSDEQWKQMNSPSITARNAIVKLIYDKYYAKHLNSSKAFQRFHMKDSWLRATMLNYQALKRELHSKHCLGS